MAATWQERLWGEMRLKEVAEASQACSGAALPGAETLFETIVVIVNRDCSNLSI